MFHVRVTNRGIWGDDGRGGWTLLRTEAVDSHYVVDAPTANIARKCAYMYENGDDTGKTPMKKALANTELLYEGSYVKQYLKGIKANYERIECGRDGLAFK